MTFSLAGPGKVGASLAHWLVASGARLIAVGARRPAQAELLTAQLGGRAVALETLRSGPSAQSETPAAGSDSGCDLLLIAVSDPALEGVARQLAQRPQAKVALHTSGSRGAEALAALRPTGTKIGAFHPLKAFPRVLRSTAAAEGTFFALDGDPEALEVGRRLAGTWRAESARVDAAARPLYHFAASLAAGGVVTLLATADRIARLQGLPTAVTPGYLRLAIGALEAALEAAERGDEPARAITGPLARGDLETVRTQLAQLAREDPEAVALCVQLALETLRHAGFSAAERRQAAERLAPGSTPLDGPTTDGAVGKDDRNA